MAKRQTKAVKDEKSTTEPNESAAPPVVDAPKLAVFSVEIPNCLLGEKFVLAGNAELALDKYKGSCGITSHEQPAIVTQTELDPSDLPEGLILFG